MLTYFLIRTLRYLLRTTQGAVKTKRRQDIRTLRQKENVAYGVLITKSLSPKILKSLSPIVIFHYL
jgi:hypothetical protein